MPSSQVALPLQEEADGTLTPEHPNILELEARADRIGLAEEAQAVRDFQRRLDYNMRKVRWAQN